MKWLWLLPDELLPLVVVGLALAVIAGLLAARRAALIVVALACLPLVIDVGVDLAFALLPGWLLALLAFVIAVQCLRMAASVVIGDDAAGHMLGHLAAVACLGCLRLLFVPIRMLGWAVVGLARRVV